MEVPMSKTKRRLLQFDSLEGKVLLSTGMDDDLAKTKHHDTIKPFVMNGSLSGLPNGSPGVAGYTATSFPVAGHLASMGSVHGSFSLADPFIPIGKLPRSRRSIVNPGKLQGNRSIGNHSNKEK